VRARKRDRRATQHEQCDLLLKASEQGASVARVSRCAEVRSAVHGVDMALDINKCATAYERRPKPARLRTRGAQAATQTVRPGPVGTQPGPGSPEPPSNQGMARRLETSPAQCARLHLRPWCRLLRPWLRLRPLLPSANSKGKCERSQTPSAPIGEPTRSPCMLPSAPKLLRTAANGCQ